MLSKTDDKLWKIGCFIQTIIYFVPWNDTKTCQENSYKNTTLARKPRSYFVIFLFQINHWLIKNRNLYYLEHLNTYSDIIKKIYIQVLIYSRITSDSILFRIVCHCRKRSYFLFQLLQILSRFNERILKTYNKKLLFFSFIHNNYLFGMYVFPSIEIFFFMK